MISQPIHFPRTILLRLLPKKVGVQQMKFGSQQCSIELSVVVVFNDDSSHWHTFHQTAAATSAQINFTISTACTTKRIRDSSIVCSIKPKVDDQFFVGLRVLCDWQTLLPFQIFVILNSSGTLPYPKGENIGQTAIFTSIN